MTDSTTTTPNASATKRIEIRLSALTRVEFMQTVEVPADLTNEEANDLVNALYERTDGSQFWPDDHYWERGHCYTVDAENNVLPSLRAQRIAGGVQLGPNDLLAATQSA